MRLIVFTAIFVTVAAVLASAETPSMLARCSTPDRCIFINNGPCGSLLVMQNGTISPMMPDDPRLPTTIRGVCGFVDPDYYTPLKSPRPAYCEGPSCNVTLDNSVNRP
ncbi:MAG: hypothetical protein ACAH83_18940 [Alphaproteobacteria bacterium]